MKMNYSIPSRHRNQCVPVGSARSMPPAPCYRPPAPQPPARGGYGSGFCDGFCDGVGNFIKLAGKVLPFTRLFR